MDTSFFSQLNWLVVVATVVYGIPDYYPAIPGSKVPGLTGATPKLKMEWEG